MMALVCAVALSATSYRAGATPPPTASIICQNNGASAVVVTGVQLFGHIFGCSTPGAPVAMGNALPPYGPGAPVSVGALSSSTVGPFPITVGSAASNQGQPSHAPTFILMIGAVVLGSDGSRNTAAEGGITVSYTIPPKPHTQGGQLIFSSGVNSLPLFAGWL